MVKKSSPVDCGDFYKNQDFSNRGKNTPVFAQYMAWMMFLHMLQQELCTSVK